MSHLSITKTVFGICALFSSTLLYANDILLVTHVDTKIESLTQREVKNLYMGAALTYEVTPLALAPNNSARVVFNTKVLGLTESRIQSYWAQMRFTGRKKPPQTLASEMDIIKQLTSSPNSIGYISAEQALPDKLKVLFSTEKNSTR